MKTKLCVLIFLLAAAFAQAQTNNLTALLQQGLFEEQANRNLDAAIADYTSLATQFDKDRQLAATAVFRLGECYRAQGKTNEAAAQYQRILRDFSNEQTLATLSRQNLTGMGVGTQQSSKLDSEDVSQLSAQLAELEKLRDNPEKQARVVLALFPDEGLKRMLLHLPLLQENELAFKNNLPDKPGRFLYALSADASDLLSQESRFSLAEAQRELKKQFQFIAQRVDFILGLQKERYALLKEMVVAAPVKNSSPADEEDQEIQRIQQMIKNSPDLINARVDGSTPLGKAASNGWLKVAAYLMDHGADVNSSYALSAAVAAGNRAMVELLLSRGADVSAMDNTAGRTLLQTAVQKGYQSVVEVLLANKADVNAQAISGDTALDSAASAGQVKILKILLAAGANPNLVNHDDNSGTMGGRRGGQPILQGRTALSFAAERGSAEMVKLLLDAKADPNGGTLDAPLFGAIFKQDALSAELLLQAGANPNAVGAIDLKVRPNSADLMNQSGHLTPLWLAIYMKQLPMVQLLLKYKADPNDSQTDGNPLLFSARDKPDILEALLAAGGKIDSHNSHDWTLWNGVVENKNAASVEILLKHGANPNMADNNGNAPLHLAAGYLVDRKIFELLFDHKADPNVRNSAGQTPLDLLKRSLMDSTVDSDTKVKINELADLLRQHGALDKLPDWDRIIVSRPSANFTVEIFRKGTNDWNHFTLLELIYRTHESYGLQTGFPDLSRVVIARPGVNGAAAKRIEINLLNATNSIDFAKDMPLEFGDVVEIPERGHTLAEKDNWFNGEMQKFLWHFREQAGEARLVVAGGRTIQMPLKDFIPNHGAIGNALISSSAQNVLTSSSDFSRVKVTRRNLKTKKTDEWILDCSQLSRDKGYPYYNCPQLLLRDGDVIEVPEKP